MNILNLILKIILFLIALIFLYVLLILLVLYYGPTYKEDYNKNKKEWDFLDKVVYINLENRPDRRDQIQSELSSKIPSDKIIRLNAVYDIRHLGCSQSHIKALEMAIDNGWNNVLIVEDDAMWNNYDKGYKRLAELISQNPNYDVITLGNIGAYFDPNTGRLSSAQTATAYLVNNHYFHILLNNFKEGFRNLSKVREMKTNEEMVAYEQKYCVDQYWKVLQPRDKWFIVHPALMVQRPSKSSISGVDVDYKSYFNL